MCVFYSFISFVLVNSCVPLDMAPLITPCPTYTHTHTHTHTHTAGCLNKLNKDKTEKISYSGKFRIATLLDTQSLNPNRPSDAIGIQIGLNFTPYALTPYFTNDSLPHQVLCW